MAPPEIVAPSSQEEVQRYEAEVAERQKSLQEMKASEGNGEKNSCENSRHVRGDFSLAGKLNSKLSNSCEISEKCKHAKEFRTAWGRTWRIKHSTLVLSSIVN